MFVKIVDDSMKTKLVAQVTRCTFESDGDVTYMYLWPSLNSDPDTAKTVRLLEGDRYFLMNDTGKTFDSGRIEGENGG